MTVADETHRQIVRTANQWRARLAEATVTEQERLDFAAWIAADPRHKEIYDQAVAYWAAFDSVRPGDIDADLREPIWPERLTAALDRAGTLFAGTQVRMAATAAVLMIVFMPIILMQISQQPGVPVEIHTPTAAHNSLARETKTVTLADGTVATLGAFTEIETYMLDTARIVRLSGGAAFFDVAHDKDRPFTVETGALTATALGTQFDVRNNGGVARVGVAEGKVRVTHPFVFFGMSTWFMTGQNLEEGQQIAAVERRGIMAAKSIRPESVGAWQDGLLLYDGATLEELVADANRHHDRTIVLASLPSETLGSRINASFLSRDIDAMLDMLPQLFPVTIDRSSADTVHIRPRSERSN